MSTPSLSPEPASPGPAHALRGLCGGRVHLPGDPGYDAARAAANPAVDQHPAAVAVPRSAREIAAVVRAAGDLGLRVAPQATGHNAGPLAARGLADVVLLRLSALDTVAAAPGHGLVRVGGGARWEPAVAAVAAHGDAVLHGSSPEVGIAGHVLGGGIGWCARKLGLAGGSVRAAELVLADGTQVRADADHDAELFWAVRGGGGGFGIVTALELRTFPLSTAYAGLLLWDLRHAAPVLRAWAAWAPEAPDEVTTAFRVLRVPHLPAAPAALRGRPLAVIDGAVLGSDERGEELLAGLRALRPALDTFARVPARSLLRLRGGSRGGAPTVATSTMLHSLPDAAVDAFLAETGLDSRSTLAVAELRQLGGALGRPDPTGGALDHLDAQFVTYAAAPSGDADAAAAGREDGARLREALGPFDNGRAYLNLTESPVATRTAYGVDRWRRLTTLRRAVDPHRRLVANHPID